MTLYFVIPRAPSFDFPSDTVFLADNSTVGFSRTPANFSFTGDIRMIGKSRLRCSLHDWIQLIFADRSVTRRDTPADASNSWLPVHFNDLEITVLDMNTNKKIGTGHWKDKTIGRKDPAYLTLPVDFSYSAVNATDSTCESANGQDELFPIWTPSAEIADDVGSGMYNACGHRWTGTQRPGEWFWSMRTDKEAYSLHCTHGRSLIPSYAKDEYPWIGRKANRLEVGDRSRMSFRITLEQRLRAL